MLRNQLIDGTPSTCSIFKGVGFIIQQHQHSTLGQIEQVV